MKIRQLKLKNSPRINKKLQFCSNPKYSNEVSSVLNPIKERELSKSMLEVAAIIAYKQPVKRGEIEKIRGVSCDHAINKLIEYELIEEVGRLDAPLDDAEDNILDE